MFIGVRFQSKLIRSRLGASRIHESAHTRLCQVFSYLTKSSNYLFKPIPFSPICRKDVQNAL